MGLLGKYLYPSELAISVGGQLALGGLLRAKIELRKCEVLLLAGHSRRVVDIAQKLAGQYRGLFLPEMLGDLYGVLGNAYLMLSDYPGVEETAQASIALQIKAGNTAGIASCRNALGVMYEDTGREDLALEQYRQALELYQQIGDQTGIGNSLVNIGTVLNGMKRAEESEAAFRRSIDLLEQSWDKVTLGFAYSNYSVLLGRQGRLDEMMECLDRSIEIRREIGDHYGLGFSLSNVAGQQFRSGQWGKAAATLNETIAMRESIGERYFLASNYFSLGRILMELGRYGEARQKAERGTDLGTQLGQPDISTNGWLLLAELAHRQGDHGQMKLNLDQAAGCLPGIAEEARYQILEAYCRLGRGDAAGTLQVMNQIHQTLESLPPRLRAEAFLLKAQFGIFTKKPDSTIREDLEQAVKRARENIAEGIHILANALMQYGEWLASSGGDTMSVMSEAEGLFRQMGNDHRLKQVGEIHGKNQLDH